MAMLADAEAGPGPVEPEQVCARWLASPQDCAAAATVADEDR